MVSPAFLIPSSCICGSGMTGYITAGLEYKQKPFYMSVITQQNAGLLIRCEILMQQIMLFPQAIILLRIPTVSSSQRH